MSKNKKLILLTLMFPLVFTGCAGNPFGKDDFACKKAAGNGVRCESAKDVYRMTNASDRVTQSDNYDGDDAVEYKSATIGDEPVVAVESERAPSHLLPSSDKPVPVRTNAKIIRVKIFPYEDRSGNFHAGDYVFSEVEQRKWTLAKEQMSRSEKRMIRPLETK